MTFEREELRDRYFSWLLSLIEEDCEVNPWDYEKLLRLLYSREFYWTLDMDENRALDGIDLRISYIDKNELIDSDYILDAIGGPCTILEMLIALADRYEVHVMSNTEYGNRTGEWFWLMINNLGLMRTCENDDFDSGLANHILDVFLNREYTYDGRGGLFYIPQPRRDLRNVEIWYQINWYFTEVFE